MKVILVPGYNSDQGENTVDLLIPLLARAGHEVIDISYAGAESGALRQLYRTKSVHNQRTGHEIAAKVRAGGEPVAIIAHSNGVAITSFVVETLQGWELLDLIDKVIVIHGALTRGYRWPCRVINFWGEDKVLTYGATLRSKWSHTKCFWKQVFTRECTGSRWGDYGAHCDMESRNAANIKTPPGHSDLFKVPGWLARIVSLV